MNKKKIIIIIIIAIIVIGLAVGIYFYLKKTKTQEKTPPTTTTSTPKAEAKLIIKTKPINAKLSISAMNSSFIKTTTAPAEIEVPAEKLYIIAYYPYYENLAQEIEIKSGETKNLELTLIHSGFEIKEGGPIQAADNNQPNNLIPNP